MTVLFVVIPNQVFEHIQTWAEAAYPHEGCGLLIGRLLKDRKDVVRFAPLENKLLKRSFADIAAHKLAANDPRAKAAEEARLSTLPEGRKDKPEIGFAFDPTEFNREALKAEKDNLDIVGILHTHPDHPPVPSQIDASQPFLAQW